MESTNKKILYRAVDSIVINGKWFGLVLFISIVHVAFSLKIEVLINPNPQSIEFLSNYFWAIFLGMILVGYPIGTSFTKLIFKFASKKEHRPTWMQAFRFCLFTQFPLFIFTILQLFAFVTLGGSDIHQTISVTLKNCAVIVSILIILYAGAYLGNTSKRRILLAYIWATLIVVAICAIIMAAAIAIRSLLG